MTTQDIIKAEPTEVESAIEVEQIPEPVTRYDGGSTLILTATEQEKLQCPFDEEMLEIKPNGLVYLPSVYLRKRLNAVIGAGQWCLIPRTPPFVKNNRVMYHGALFIRGHYVAEAIGGQDYIESNSNMNWDDALEGAKTDCLSRCCKDLGINAECWEKDFTQRWIEQYATKKWDAKKNKFVFFKKPKQAGNNLKKDIWSYEEDDTTDQNSDEETEDMWSFDDKGNLPTEVSNDKGSELHQKLGFGKHKELTFLEVPLSYLKALLKPPYWNKVPNNKKALVKQAVEERENNE